MSDAVQPFYDALAEHYHLLFADWQRSIDRQADVLAPLLQTHGVRPPARVLDCACGIGTQSLGLAARGYRVTASDLSPAAVARTRVEAQQRKLAIDCHVADMTSLGDLPGASFDAVLACDNALPHLEASQLTAALSAIRVRLIPGGRFLASVRDYDALLPARPTAQPPSFFGTPGHRRIVHQVWDWHGADGLPVRARGQEEDRYTVHLYLTQEGPAGSWTALHFTSEYRVLLRGELSAALRAAGFDHLQWLFPETTGYYQPLILATAV